MTRIGISNFVKRQTVDSPFSYFGGSWEELAALAQEYFYTKKPSFRPGVIQVVVPAANFYSAVVELNSDSVLASTWKPRSVGELPSLQTTVANAAKAEAKHVVLILYSAEALSENGGTRSTNCQWEVVSINASPVLLGNEPMHPVTMARNFLALPGGTKTQYTAQQFAEAIAFWNAHAMAG